MAFQQRQLYASRMTLRPNPVMQLHLYMARRDVLHLDTFALVREQEPDTVLFAIELRRGGRGEPIERIYLQARIGSDAAPIIRDARTGRAYDVTDCIRFNALPATAYQWAVAYHAAHILPAVRRIRRTGFVRSSLLFHYFRVYDLDPSHKFNNFYGMSGAARYRVLRGAVVADK